MASSNVLKNIGFERDGSKYYLTIGSNQMLSEADIISYQMKMLLHQQHSNYLPVHVEEVDGRITLFYDITGKRKLSQWLETKRPSLRQWFELLFIVARTVDQCGEFMLHTDKHLLHEQYIFVGEQPEQTQIAYLPLRTWNNGDSSEHFRRLTWLAIQDDHGLPSWSLPFIDLMKSDSCGIQEWKNAYKAGWLQFGNNLDQFHREEVKRMKRFRWQDWFRWTKWERTGIDQQKLSEKQQRSHAEADRTLVLNNKSNDHHPTIIIRQDNREERRDIRNGRFVIGRNELGVDYQIDQFGISRMHCEIEEESGGLTVKDLGSVNGTLLNGEQMAPYHAYSFRPGDCLSILNIHIMLEQSSN